MPITILERIKTFLWTMLEPLFPTLRDMWVFFGFIKHNERQPFTYGRLKQGQNERSLRQALMAAGFSNDYLGWIDPDEVLNMRKVVHTMFQYHVRLFKDGEVRGHYEYTPESQPFKHLYDVGMKDGSSYLKPLLSPLVGARGVPTDPTPNSTPPQPRSADSR